MFCLRCVFTHGERGVDAFDLIHGFVGVAEQLGDTGRGIWVNADTNGGADFGFLFIIAELLEGSAEGFFHAGQSLLAMRGWGDEDDHKLIAPEQVEFLLRTECQYAQGYFYGKAMPLAEVLALSQQGVAKA